MFNNTFTCVICTNVYILYLKFENIFVSEWHLLVRSDRPQFLTDLTIQCYLPNARLWGFKRDDRIRLLFSNATNLVLAAFSLKHDGNQWYKEKRESFVGGDFDAIYAKDLPDSISFVIRHVTSSYSGDFWCESGSKRAARPSPKVALQVRRT